MSGMDRRRFLKVTAITGTSAALAGCGNPEHQLMRFVPEEEITPGIAVWKPSVCPLCSAGCGVQARVMDGDAEVFRNGQPGITRMGLPRKLEGDREHPVSQGRLCVRGQAALQVTYHPDRLTAPLRRSGERGSGSFAGSLLGRRAGRSGRADRRPGGAGPGRSHRVPRPAAPRPPAGAGGGVPAAARRAGAGGLRVLRRRGLPPRQRAQLRPLPAADLRSRAIALRHRLRRRLSRHLELAAGAERRLRAHAQGQPAIRTKFVQIEPRVSQTGASADEWLAVRPGTEGAVALGLAHVILRDGLAPASGAGRAGALVEGWAAGLPAFAPAEVEKRTGVAAARLERIAREFAAHRPSVAIIGGAGLAHANGLDQALAVNALNALVGSIERPGRRHLHADARSPPAPPARSLRDLLAAAPATQLLLLDEANPVFAAPPAWKAAEALAPDSVHRLVRVVPRRHQRPRRSRPARPLVPRGWTESQPESGAAVAVATTVGPAMRPLYTTRAMPDVLLDVGRRLKQPLESAAAVAELRGDAAGAGPGRARRTGRGRPPPRRPRREPGPSRASTATPPSIRSTSCPTRRRRSTTGRWPTCRGCRSCPTR